VEKVEFRFIQASDNKKLANVIRNVFEEYDVPKCGTVYSDPTTDDLFVLFQKERAAFFVVEVDGIVAGCGGIYPTKGLPDKYAELVKLYLSNTHRGKGLGKYLLEKCIATAKKMGYTHLYLESFPQFVEAIHLYQQYGFEYLPNAMGQSGHTACNVWMLKPI